MLPVIEYAQIANKVIEALDYSNCYPQSLYEPVTYALRSGGKRLRPALMLAVADAFGADIDKLFNTAVAIEIFHNFTLVHDDIMDHSDYRHGRETVIKKYGVDSAVLVGDTMLTLATILLTNSPAFSDEMKTRILDAFNLTAIKVYRGQQLDMDFEKADNVTLDDYILMIGLKTAALIGGACHIGALAANADAHSCSKTYEYGFNLGLAFQLQDDLLDTFGDTSVFGKKTGSDIRNGKRTWLYIVACNEAPQRMAEAMKLTGDQRVEAVTKIYRDLDLPARCEKAIDDYINAAIDMVDHTLIGHDSKAHFVKFARDLIGRTK